VSDDIDFASPLLHAHLAAAVESASFMADSGERVLHSIVYIGPEMEWLGTVMYGLHSGNEGRKQATFRALGQIGAACGAIVCGVVGDIYMNSVAVEDLAAGVYTVPTEDPRSHEAIIAQVLVQEGVFPKMLVRRYGRNDDGTLRWYPPEMLPAGNYLDVCIPDFSKGWHEGGKTLRKALRLAGDQAAAFGVMAADREAWGIA
jgi:hypothetical protein